MKAQAQSRWPGFSLLSESAENGYPARPLALLVEIMRCYNIMVQVVVTVLYALLLSVTLSVLDGCIFGIHTGTHTVPHRA